ncbi:MAG: putative HTH-type transcriptional regulator YttP [Candidatus Dichloromethanomonas elyunquensis]|nr:MAG: putative HTH-type transcriptional regulator YttP [Candidatus Dichloromethanomonas elyunquensis]
MITPNEDQCTYDRILNAAVYLIKEKGVSLVKIREIAQIANVNVASINYHFHSKERLIYFALNKLFPSLKDALRGLEDGSIPAKERLKKFLTAHIESMLQFPQPLKHFFTIISYLHDNQKESIQLHQEWQLSKLERIISEITGCSDQTKLKVLKSQLFYAAIMPSLINSYQRSSQEKEFPDIQTQIEILIEQFFGL